MSNTSNTGVKHIKKNVESNSPKVTDFGIRTVSSQNFSKIVALPKLALLYRGQEVRHVNVKLIEFGDEKFIKLTPVKLGDENVE